MSAVIYHMPGSCSRVALVALEAVGIDYEDHTVALLAGDQRKPWYLAVNPKSKVPVIVDEGQTITELPAILYHLASAHPASGLLPLAADGKPAVAVLSDLIWLAGAVQPTTARIFRPGAVAPNCLDEVKSVALAQLSDLARLVTARLGDGWWYGDHWSALDTFVAWIFDVARRSGFPLSDHPVLAAHINRAESSPAFSGAIARERAAIARDNVAMPPGFEL